MGASLRRRAPRFGLTLAIAGALAACGGTYPIRGGVMHHDPVDPVTVRLRDGTVIEGIAFPGRRGEGWWVGRPIEAADVVEARPRSLPVPAGVRRVELRLVDGRTVDGLAVEQRGPDPQYMLAELHPVETLVDIVQPRRAAGILTGAGLGWLGGGVFALVVRYATADDERVADDDRAADDDWVSPLIIILGIVGGGVVGHGMSPITYTEAPPVSVQTSLIPLAGGGLMAISGRF